MRLLVSGFILAVTALDFGLGAHAGSKLQMASLVAGLLLAVSVIVDLVRPGSPGPAHGAHHPPDAADPSLLP